MGRYKKTNPEDEARARLARPEPFGGSLNPPPELSNFPTQFSNLLYISNIYKVFKWLVYTSQVRAVYIRFLLYYVHVSLEVRSEIIRPVDLYSRGMHPVAANYMLRNSMMQYGIIEKIGYGQYRLTSSGIDLYKTFMGELARRTVTRYSWY